MIIDFPNFKDTIIKEKTTKIERLKLLNDIPESGDNICKTPRQFSTNMMSKTSMENPPDKLLYN